MIKIQDIIKAIIKSTLIATTLFWLLLISSEDIGRDGLFLIAFSTIPIFIICAVGYTITIMPILWNENGRLTNKQLFNIYFPYYAIIAFGICLFFIIDSNFGNIEICFFGTAFFTSITAWLIILKPQKNEII